MKNSLFVRKLVGTAILTAVVLSLQLVLGSVKFGPFNITFTLVPIILGAVLYGPLSAAFLGAVFGLTVCFSVISGNDAGGFVLFSQRPIITLLLCLVKSTAAGYLAGLFAKRKSAVYLSAAVAPLVNTGIFILGLVVFFRDTLVLWANGEEAVVQFILFSILGVNFLAELLLNLLLVPVILRILSGVRFTRDEIENT
ncbi:MAG: ECF transporter S component [Oribacterium parvum]|uniref:ECF transporter S component n=1 Tax=Oribacterium parvum TaxID=1501329 RepID=UPI001CABFAE7|nr:ECF transporter S component [Oribacterium parvum]MBF1268137.1 ECF transporter S component [Oribacterium parvum]